MKSGRLLVGLLFVSSFSLFLSGMNSDDTSKTSKNNFKRAITGLLVTGGVIGSGVVWYRYYKPTNRNSSGNATSSFTAASIGSYIPSLSSIFSLPPAIRGSAWVMGMWVSTRLYDNMGIAKRNREIPSGN